MMNWQLAGLGALPALGAMWYFDRLDAKRPEPRSSLRRVAIAGGVSVIPCAVLELVLMKTVQLEGFSQVLFSAFVVAAAIEELAKVLCVRFFIWNRPEFDERMDGIVYAARAGLGFALVENVIYLLGTKSAGGFVGMYIGRAVLAVPGHAIYAGIMGYCAARRRFDNAGPGLVGGYLIAVLLHGIYDASLFSLPLVAAKDQSLIIPVIAIPIAVIVVGAIILKRMATRAVALDDVAEARARAALPPVAVA